MKYICNFEGCNKEFNRNDTLKIHKRVHSGERPYSCDYENCNKAFSQQSDLTKHIRIHTGERPYSCDYESCGKSFIELGALVKHKRVHTGEKPYVCDYEGCGKSFSQSSKIKIHKRVHTGERPYSCDYDDCGESFSNSSSLIVHKRVHTGERPYTCNYEGCNKSFSRTHHLILHIRVHTGDKPYICDYEGCGKSFNQLPNLSSHKRVHTGEKPYKCNIDNCDQSFSRSHHLKDHIKRWHTEEGKMAKKKSEDYTSKLLKKEGIDFKREHQVSFSCNGGTFCKIDFIHINKGIIFAIENDEHQHETYSLSCELRRMADVKSVFVQEGNTMPLVWIRYNPDTFYKGESKIKIDKKDRINKVVNLINKLSEVPENISPLTIYYCFYDTYKDGSLCIFDNIDFDSNLKSMTYCIS